MRSIRARPARGARLGPRLQRAGRRASCFRLSLPLLSLVDAPAVAVRARAQVRELLQPRRGGARRVGLRARQATGRPRARAPTRPRAPRRRRACNARPRTSSTRTYTGGDYTNARLDGADPRRRAGGEYYDPAVVAVQPSWDANRNAKMWVRADAHAADGRPDGRRARAAHRTPRAVPPQRHHRRLAQHLEQRQQDHRRHEGRRRAAGAGRRALHGPAPSAGCLDYDTRTRTRCRRTPRHRIRRRRPRSRADALDRLRATAQGARHLLRVGLPGVADGRAGLRRERRLQLRRAAAAPTAQQHPGCSSSRTARSRSAATSPTTASCTPRTCSSRPASSSRCTAPRRSSARSRSTAAVASTVGSSGDNVVFDDGVFPLLTSFGGAAPVQGSWRELPAS